jgi:hypothetical protein
MISTTVSPVELAAASRLDEYSTPRAGDTVVIHSRGRWRTAMATKVGRVRVATEYSTEAGGFVTRKAVTLDDRSQYAGILR